jgi:hypothetical protein
MAFTDIYTAATSADSTLIKQMAVAIHQAAQDVLNEDSGTENHANRLIWARRVTKSNDAPVTEAKRWVWAALENATLQAAPQTSTDNDVAFVVGGLVDTMANRG